MVMPPPPPRRGRRRRRRRTFLSSTTTAFPALFATALSISLLTATFPSASSARGLSPGLGGGGGGVGDENKQQEAVSPVERVASPPPLSSSLPPHKPPAVVAGDGGGGTAKDVTTEDANLRRLFAGKVASNLLASLVLVLTAGTMAGLTVGLLGAWWLSPVYP